MHVEESMSMVVDIYFTWFADRGADVAFAAVIYRSRSGRLDRRLDRRHVLRFRAPAARS